MLDNGAAPNLPLPLWDHDEKSESPRLITLPVRGGSGGLVLQYSVLGYCIILSALHIGQNDHW